MHYKRVYAKYFSCLIRDFLHNQIFVSCSLTLKLIDATCTGQAYNSVTNLKNNNGNRHSVITQKTWTSSPLLWKCEILRKTKDHTFILSTLIYFATFYIVYTYICTPFAVQTISNHNQLNPCMLKRILFNHQNGIWNSVMQVMMISNRISVHITFNTALHEKVCRA
jgi:hypothetical protein